MYCLGIGLSHDSAAVLLHDDVVVCGVEEERLTRLKHCAFPPLRAIRACLEQGEIGLSDVDVIACGNRLEWAEGTLWRRTMSDPTFPFFPSVRAMLGRVLEDAFGHDASDKICSVEHHLSHALSAYGIGGLDPALVVTLDGAGDGKSGLVLSADRGDLRTLATVQCSQSLGHLYEGITQFLGYRLFDEYKVMGLAPYGDPDRFRTVFEAGYELLDGGDFRVDRKTIADGLVPLLPPRRSGEPFTQRYRDVAAALQAALERILLHFFTHHQRTSGHRNLCYAGGLAHNCAANGKLVAAGLFDRVFVQPAASDAGIALGAAIHAMWRHRRFGPAPRGYVFLGPAPPSTAEIGRELGEWSDWVDVARCEAPWDAAAERITNGEVVAWVQGRCEFGPRALGNRCILADPRPPENKDRINRMIKRREAYRPFAPAVLEEHVGEFFVTPGTMTSFPVMSVALPVREEARELLGAVTHVDATARVQTVNRATNEPFWLLLRALHARIGVPVVLNTSFNNHREPIVNDVHDAMTCFLTTGLDALVFADFVVTKKDPRWSDPRRCFVSIPDYVELAVESGRRVLRTGWWSDGRLEVSAETFDLLSRSDGHCDLETLAELARVELTPALLAVLDRAWSERLVRVSPSPRDWPSDTVPAGWMGHWA